MSFAKEDKNYKCFIVKTGAMKLKRALAPVWQGLFC